MAKQAKKDFHTVYTEYMEKHLPENERILSGGYNLQNPKWMPKKKAGNVSPSKATPAKKKTKSTTLFGL